MIDYITFYFIVVVLASHFIADFICQTDEMAKGKSKDNFVLFGHCYLYSILMAFLSFYLWFIFFPLNDNFKYIPAIYLIYLLVTHFATDWITSRINSKLYKQGKIHLFFVGVGLDQLIHYITIFGFWAWVNYCL